MGFLNVHHSASENLRVIRTLMERATIYRAISAPTALFSGITAVLVGVCLCGRASDDLSLFLFGTVWVALFLLSNAFNAFLVRRDALRRGDPFLSSGLKLAFRAVAPPLFSGFVMSLAFLYYLEDPVLCSLCWVVFYGLAMLSTSEFAPPSIRILGAGFVLIGLIATPIFLGQGPAARTISNASLLMAGTFGLLHLVYATAIFLTRPRRESAIDAQTLTR